jgi:polyferredoxin
MVLLLGVLIGRLLCGWVCPFGFLQDLLYKIPTRKFHLPEWTGWGKYVVLIGLVLVIPFFWGENSAWGFCRFCPASAVQVTIPNLVTGGMATFSMGTAIKLGVLLAVIGLVILSSRGFCKAFCPIGAMLAPLNYITFWKIRVPTQNCISCRKCDRSCPQQMTPSKNIAEGTAPNRSGECILCYECQRTCPVDPPRPGRSGSW